MKKNKKSKSQKVFGFAYFVFFFAMFFTVPAQAYIDPATTAMLTQIVAGIFITLGVLLGVFRNKVKFFFQNKSVKRTQRKIEKENAKQDKDINKEN